MWSPTGYRFKHSFGQGCSLQVNVLGKPRWRRIFRNPYVSSYRNLPLRKGKCFRRLRRLRTIHGGYIPTENSKELLTASSSTQLPRVSDISGYWLVNTNKSGSNHWACLKEVSLLLQLFLLSLICYSVIWAQFSYAHLVLLCQDRSTLRMCYGIRPHSSLTAYWFIDNSNHL